MTTSSTDELTTFICLATGDFYGLADVYINRMFDMLQAHSPHPFQLYCITDQHRAVNPAIKLIDCSKWNELKRDGMRATTTKIGLFNPAYMPTEDFIYLDLTLVIQKSMTPLIDYTKSSEEPLVIIKAWHQETYNSSVMRIRPRDLNFIYEAFRSGEAYNQKTKGDQDFIHAVIHNRNKSKLVKHFHPDFICSFKKAIRTSRTNPAESKRMIENSIIVKFHGSPRMHNALHPLKRFIKYTIGNIWYGQIGLPFNIHSIQQAWECPKPIETPDRINHQ